MKFTEQEIPGVFLIEFDVTSDERGTFARVWDEKEFTEHGLFSHIVHANVSHNPRAGTLRGLHYQTMPHEEAKIVRCSRGSVFDVALDLRPTSPTFKKWIGLELSADKQAMLYIPKGCAHGFQTLEDDVEITYLMSAEYQHESARGVRFNDPAFGITWPLPVSVMSEKDRSYPDFS